MSNECELVNELVKRVMSAIDKVHIADLKGEYEQGWTVSVRLQPDGSVTTDCQPGVTVGEGEWNGNVPHELSIYSTRAEGCVGEDDMLDGDDWVNEDCRTYCYEHVAAEVERHIIDWVDAGNYLGIAV